MNPPEKDTINAKQFTRTFLKSTAYLTINKTLIKLIGLNETALLSDLISKEEYFEQRNMLEDGWFFNTEQNRFEDTGLSPKQQQLAIKKLQKLEIISIQRKSLPAKQWFKINHKRIQEILINTDGRTSPYKKQNKSLQKAELTNKNNVIRISNNKSISYSKELLKKTKSSEVIFPVSKFLARWNSFKVRKHSSSGKTYQKAHSLCKSLLSGTFGDKRKLNNDFLEKNSIPGEWLTAKWPEKDVLIGIRRLAQLFIDGYWPPDKSKLPKDLSTLLYNPTTGTSMFLLVMKNKPIPLASKVAPDPTPHLTKLFIPLFNGKEISPKDNKRLIEGIKSIALFHSKIPVGECYGKISTRFGQVPVFCQWYIRFIQEQDWIDHPGVELISTKNKVWGMFIKQTEDDLGLPLR